MNKNLSITIFIPVYNGEKYLPKTLDSIQKQTYKNFEVLLLDDSSTDSSFSIINDFAQKDTRFRVFVKENGGMVPKAINFIMPYIKGDFFFYSSQDDIFSKDLLEKMITRQNETNAETVLPIMEYYYEEKKNNKKIIGLNGNKNVILTGKEALIESLNWNIHGFALFKSNLIKKEKFPEDAFDSDEFITRKLFFKSNKLVFSEGVFYYRKDNTKSITNTFSDKNFTTLNTYKRLYDLLVSAKVEKKYLIRQKIEILDAYLKYQQKIKTFTFDNEYKKDSVVKYLFLFKKTFIEEQLHIKNINRAILTLKFKNKIRNIFISKYLK